MDRFSDYGEVKNLHLNLDRRTGYVKVRTSNRSLRCGRVARRAALSGFLACPAARQRARCVDTVADASLFPQGYALVEYETKEEALKAIQEAPQEPFLEKVLSCDFAFVQPPAGCVSALS